MGREREEREVRCLPESAGWQREFVGTKRFQLGWRKNATKSLSVVGCDS